VRRHETPNPEPKWSALSKGRSPGEHRPGNLALARAWGCRVNGLPGGAKLRSGRAGDSHGEPSVVGNGRSAEARRKACGGGRLATARNCRHGSCVHGSPPGGSSGKELARRGKRSRTSRWLCAGGDRPTKPARKHGPARAGTAPREGKAWRAAPGTRAARNKAAKRRDATVATGLARDPHVPRAKPEPSRGARTLRTAPTGVWRPPSVETAFGPTRRQRGTRRKCVRGSKNPRRGRPAALKRPGSA